MSEEQQAAKSIPQIQRELSEPFPPEQVRWRIDGQAHQGKARVVAYIDVRTVTARLNDVVGIDNWKTEVNVTDQVNGVAHCRLSVRFPGHDDWVSRDDVGSESQQKDAGDRTKAAVSDSIKRAAVHFGVGAYLYRLGATQAEVTQDGKRISVLPSLPLWALPNSHQPAGPQAATQLNNLIGTYAKSATLEPAKLIATFLQRYGYKDGTPLASVERRHLHAMLQDVNARIGELAAGNLPPDLPQNGDQLLTWIKQLDTWAIEQKVTQAADEVLAHVMSKCATANFSTSISEWKGPQIIKAREWARSFVAEKQKKCPRDNGTAKTTQTQKPADVKKSV
jgi:hypothetical protein